LYKRRAAEGLLRFFAFWIGPAWGASRKIQPKQIFPLSSEIAPMSVIEPRNLQDHLNLPYETDDFFLAGKIAAAEAHIDSYLERKNQGAD
jgi:hypothetical protein